MSYQKILDVIVIGSLVPSSRSFSNYKNSQSQLCYYPQSRQIERINQCLERYLHCFCSMKPHNWRRWFSWEENWHNGTWRVSTGLTPYEVVYGKPLVSSAICP